MRRRQALTLLGASLPLPAAAQAPPQPRTQPPRPQTPRPQQPGPPQPGPGRLGANPALAAPPPPDLSPAAVTPPPAPRPEPPRLDDPPVPLGPGVSALPGGGWRLEFLRDAAAATPAQAASLRLIGARLAERSTGRVTLFSEASSGQDLSSIRRLSLERARRVKAELEAGGLDGRRVDIRALGRTPARAELLDLMPPGTARPAPVAPP